MIKFNFDVVLEFVGQDGLQRDRVELIECMFNEGPVKKYTVNPVLDKFEIDSVLCCITTFLKRSTFDDQQVF